MIACFFWAALALGQDARPPQKFFDSAGVRIHYIDEGDPKGPPVLLVHGFTASILMNWRIPGVTDLLAREGYRVVALDCRGHGLSEKPHDPKKYGREMAEDAIRLLDHLGIKKCHVVGYSMGGRIACKLIVDHPDRFLSAVIGGMGLTGEESTLSGDHSRLAQSLEEGKGLGPLIEALNPPGRGPVSEERMRIVNNLYLRSQDPKALAAVVRGGGGLAVSKEELRKIKLPVAAICGDEDPLLARVERMKPLVPGIKVVITPGTHLTAFGKPEFKKALLEFLKATSAANAAGADKASRQ